ncbi:MAG: hypothetical protein K5796_11375 [Lachnospiraceae bacterium]|nr:hypothetical protein [Lachnospiraceae bacterium]
MRTNIAGRKKNIKHDRVFWFMLAGNILAFLLITVIFTGLPLYLRSGYNNIAEGKYIFFMNVAKYTAIIMGFFTALYLVIRGMSEAELKAFRPIKKLDYALLFFALVLIISHLCSPYKSVGAGSSYWFHEGSVWGCLGWYMGLITYLVFIMFYFIVSRYLNYRDFVLLPVIVPAMIVFVWGIFNRFGVSFIEYDGLDPEYISSIGNINWFCGYLTVILPIIIGLYHYKEGLIRFLFAIPMFTGFFVTIINGSDSGLFALFMTLLVLFVISSKDERKMARFSEIGSWLCATMVLVALINRFNPDLLTFRGMFGDLFTDVRITLGIFLVSLAVLVYFHACSNEMAVYPKFLKKHLGHIAIIISVLIAIAVIVLIAVNTALGGTLPIIGRHEFFIYDREWGTKRSVDWEVGFKSFLSLDFWHKLIGIGPDCFWFNIVDHPDLRENVRLAFKDIRLVNAHDIFLTMLVNTGVIGLSAFIGVIVCAFKTFGSRLKEKPGLIMFILVLVMYLSNNLFSFEQITSTPFLWLAMGIGASMTVKKAN